MKRFSFSLLVASGLALGTLLLSPRSFAGTGGITTPAGFAIHRGTNLSHWLSQHGPELPRDTFLTAYDFRFIARSGFDHVRLPVDEIELWQEDGSPNEAAFADLMKAIGWARENHLRVIVDLHTVRAHHFNAANDGAAPNTLFTDVRAQEHFLGLWRQLSARLHTLPVSEVAYEIMNEPVADQAEQWNELVAKSIGVLRSLEPHRVIVVGSNRWQIPQTMPLLKVPAGDRNLILSTHTYSPLLLTHHLANWTPLKVYTGPVHYPGPVVTQAQADALAKLGPEVKDLITNATEAWGPDRLQQEIAPAIETAKKLGLPMYCGEFGCLPTVPRADRLAYYRDLVSAFERNGIAWANWEYKADFGVYEWHAAQNQTGAPDVELLDALMQRH